MAPVIAVTGATGFIGRQVVARLRTDGWAVRSLVRRPDPDLTALGATLVHGALEDRASLEELVAGCDAVVHCAGAIRARGRAEFMRINGGGTESMVRTAAADRGRPRVLVMSSLAAREPQLSAYAASKRAGERAALDQAGAGCDLCLVRPPAVYGPGDRATLPIFRQLVRGWLVTPRARARFSMIYVEDLAALVRHLLTMPAWQAAVVEPDDGRPGGHRWSELADLAEDQLGRRVRRIAVPRPVASAIAAVAEARGRLIGRAPPFGLDKVRELFHEDWLCRADDARLMAGWAPRVDLAAGFARVLARYERNGWL